MPKISALTSLAQASVDTAADVLPIVDATAPATTKKVTVQAMVNAGLAAAAPQGGTLALTGALTTTGSVGIGGAAPATTVLRLSKQGTGGTIAFGQDIQTQVQSDVTNSYSSVRSVSSTAATAFTLSQFNHFSAVQGVIGAGSTVTNQMGFEAQSSLTGAANNFGFYSNLASGTGRWNFYAAGTAANYFAGATTFADTLTVSGQASFADGSAAAPSVKVGAGNDGLYSLASGSLGLAASGRIALRLETVTNSVNYLYGYANATGGAPVLRAVGSDTNVDLALGTQGSGAFAFLSHGATTLQFRIASVASATNFWQAQGNVTSGAPTLFANGTDTNVSAIYATKGAGQHFFYTNNAANLQFKVGHVANAVNYVTAYGNATGLTPGLFAEGSDANVGLGLYSKAAGPVFTAVRGAVSAYFDNPASPVNYATITGSATGLSVVYGAAGTDAAVSTVLTCKGAGNVGLYSNSGANAILFAAHVASSVNYWTISGAATGGLPTFTTQGSDANISAYMATKGAGGWRFATGGGDQFRVMHAASAVNYFSAYGAATGSGPILYADGADAAMNANYSLKGGGSHVFYTGSTSAVQFVIAHVASTVNWLAVSGSATGNAVTIATNGSDANRSISIQPAGSGIVQVASDSLRILTSKTPASAAATGTQGQISWDADYIYVCTATDTWKRAALATW